MAIERTFIASHRRMTNTHATEIASGSRFPFGHNWSSFARLVDDTRIHAAERSLRSGLGLDTLVGKRFLDVGCGSGLFSLAAHRLGASVTSFDYDPESVRTTEELRKKFGSNESAWTVLEGSALDADFLDSLGTFDIVYSWGVLHHTGSMWEALDLVRRPLATDGVLYVAIYNDQGAESDRWLRIKRRYCRLPAFLQPPYALLAIAPYEFKAMARALLDRDPMRYVRSWKTREDGRGMSRWHDILDWVGGYPYEYASTKAIVDFYLQRGLSVQKVMPGSGLGCNEFVLRAATPVHGEAR